MTSLTQFPEDLPQTDNFLDIVLNQTPLIDVRAPVEFQQGAFSSACNLPLMDDKEREAVGICYKEQGSDEAVKLGHKLVNQQVKEPRVEAWKAYISANPNALLYCFRGGMRSKISQQWLNDAGCDITRLKGGYKAFRRYLIDYIDNIPALFAARNIQPIILAGRTGTGKTLVLQHIENQVDLEGLANHRGSTFGRHFDPQPTQINFENKLAMALIQFVESDAQHKQLIVEDEARNVGSLNVPLKLFDFLKTGQRIVLETPLSERIDITLDEYVKVAQQEYATLQDWVDFMTAAFSRIQKRLGGERYQRVVEFFEAAMVQQHKTGELEGHRPWIEILLVEYYDPMYDFQMEKNNHPVLFSGNIEEVVAYIKSLINEA